MATPAPAAQAKTAAQPAPISSRPASSSAPISGLRKAAILMVAIGDDLAKTFFQSLSQADVERVTDEITRLGNVPTEQSTQVLSEFYGLFETARFVVRARRRALRAVLRLFLVLRAFSCRLRFRGLHKPHPDWRDHAEARAVSAGQ